MTPFVGATSASASVVYRARFDECAPDGHVRTSVLLRWAQDVAWIHSTALGYGREWYARRRLWWLVRGVDLTVLAPIVTAAESTVTTRVVGWRRVWARRRTEIRASSGALAAVVLTDWVMTDARGAPTRVPAEFASRFAGDDEPFVPVRLPAAEPPTDAVAYRSRVRPQELDPMGHVNNAAYVDYLEEALVAAGERVRIGRVPRRYRLEYLAPATLDGALLARLWPLDGAVAYLLVDAAPGGRPLLRARVGPDGDAFPDGRTPRDPVSVD